MALVNGNLLKARDVKNSQRKAPRNAREKIHWDQSLGCLALPIISDGGAPWPPQWKHRQRGLALTYNDTVGYWPGIEGILIDTKRSRLTRRHNVYGPICHPSTTEFWELGCQNTEETVWVLVPDAILMKRRKLPSMAIASCLDSTRLFQ